MIRVRTGSMHPMVRLRDEMDRLFSGFLGEMGDQPEKFTPRQGYPALNLWQDDSNVYLEAELPGLDQGDVDISVLGSELTLEGRRPEPEAEVTYHRRERSTGPFKRGVRLPLDVEPDQVEASLTDGVLLVKLPKAAKAQPRKIKVNA